MEQKIPRPSIIQVVASILFIGFQTTLFSASLVAMCTYWDPCSMLSGFVLFAMSSFFGFLQYSGTFRYHYGHLQGVAVTQLVGAGTLVLGLIVSGVEAWQNGWLLAEWTWLCWGVVAVAVVSWMAWMNLRRARAVRQLKSLPGSRQISIRDLIAGCILLSVIVALSVNFFEQWTPQYAEHVSIEDAPLGLPANAKDICFCHGPRGMIAYEFNTDEKTFREWVSAGIGSLESSTSNTKLESIVTPTKIRRYTDLNHRFHGKKFALVTQGLEYDWSFEDRGVHAVFDSKSNRAYFYFHAH